MKTSNKILLAAVLIVVAYTVGYDFALKAEYDKGTYKSRFYRMTEFKVGSFDSISHNTSNIMGIRVEKGDKFAVWVDDNYKNQVKIDQQGATLNINCDTTKDLRRIGFYTGVIIICPTLKGLSAKQQLIDEDDRRNESDGRVEIDGFNQSTPLTLRVDKNVDISLFKNKLGTLNAYLGNTQKDAAELFIYKGNTIQLANLQLKGRSRLTLDNPIILKSNYQFADSTMVSLSGKSLQMVQQQ